MAAYVYIVTNKPHGTLYVGVTNNLTTRIYQHKQGTVVGFTQRYELSRLVWFESHDSITDAIYREKQLKKWRRHWKVELIELSNPDWQDLYDEIVSN